VLSCVICSVTPALAASSGVFGMAGASLMLLQSRLIMFCIGDGIYRSCNGDCVSAQCFADEARDRAEAERRAKMTAEQRAADDARQKRERDAAAARQAAQQAAELAARQAKVDTVMRQLGLPPSRRAEAERFLTMKEAADRARPSPDQLSPVDSSPPAVPRPAAQAVTTPPKPPTCHTVKKSNESATTGPTLEAARSEMVTACSRAGSSCSAIKCAWESVGMGSNLGNNWCRTIITSDVKVCPSGPGSKVSPQ